MIKNYIRNSSSAFVVQLRESIKIIEVEETMDLLFHRPIGLFVTRLAIKLGLKPTPISFLGLFCGVLAGIGYYLQDQLLMLVLASFFLEASAILDTVDGQVARLTNQSSRFGMLVDGLMDVVVFTSAYIGATMFHMVEYGWWIVLLAAISGYFHGLQSIIFDFYKNEFSFLFGGQKHYRNLTLEEVREQFEDTTGLWIKLLKVFNLDYVRRQIWMTNRKGDIKQRFEKIAFDPSKRERFREAYRKTYAPYLTSWSLFGGSNTHRTMIIVFCIFHRFDLYLLINLFLTVPLIFTGILQAKADRRFLKQFE